MQIEFESFDPNLPSAHSLIEEGHRDIEAGLVHDVNEVFDELFAELDENIKNTKRSAPSDQASFTRRKR